MSYRPTDTSEKALEALIVAELTGRTGSDTPPAGEVREYMPYGRSTEMSTEQTGEEQWTRDFISENEWQSFHTKKRSGTKTENVISRVRAWAVQDSGKSGGHLRQ